MYPGWRMRIYHNVTSAQADQAEFLCQLECDHPSLDLCDVRRIPELARHHVLEDKVDLGRWWRFLVLGDPTVRMFGIRDLDMFMLPRERDAVARWEQEGTHQFYIMRDTPQARKRAGILMPIKVTRTVGQKEAEGHQTLSGRLLGRRQLHELQSQQRAQD